MAFRTPPPIPTWILNQFGAIPENESAIGDLIETYQRGRGTIWYWRQILAIVFGGLYREFRSNKGKFLGGLFRAWCFSGIVHLAAGVLLMMHHVWLYPRNTLAHQYGMTANPIPLLTLRISMGRQHLQQWDISLFSIFLNVLILLVVGRMITATTRFQPRTLLLAYITLTVVENGFFVVLGLLMIAGHQPDAEGFLLTALIAVPAVPTLLTIGGMRGIPLPTGEGGPRQRAA